MKERKLTYHWVIVVCVFLMYAVAIGICVNCFTVFGPAMMKDMGITASGIQVVNLIASFANLIGAVFIGRVMIKFGMRLTMPVYAILLVAGLALRAIAHSTIELDIYSLIMGFGLSGVSTVPGGMLINNWFTDKKGTATGIAFSGSVVGGLIFVQLSSYMVASLGWRQANLILAAITAVILLPVSIFFVREKPQDKGMLPLGEEEGKTVSAGIATGISSKSFFKTKEFWLLAFVSFAIGFCNLGMQNNVTICLESEHGFTAQFAANIFSITMFIQIFGKFLLGAVYDKKGDKFGAIYNLVFTILSIVTLSIAVSTPMAIAFGAFFGMMSSMTTVTPPYITALVVGRRNYAQIYGLLSMFFGLGSAFGPLFASAFFDATGSFNIAWYIFAAISILTAVFSIIAAKGSRAKGYATMMD